MKRVQRVEDSLAQSGARPQCGFHISPQRTPRGKHGKANMITQKRTHAAPPPSPASPRAPVGIAARKRTNDDHDPRRNRNATYRKPSCLALTRQTAGVIECRTFRENRIAPQNSPRAHNPLCRSYNRRDATPRRPAIHDPMKQNNAASRQRGHTPPLSAARPAPPRVHPTRQYDGPAQKHEKPASQNIRFERRFLLYICALCRPKGRRRKRPYSASRYGL